MEARETMFDTYAYIETLQQTGGFTEKQANLSLRALKQALSESVATRSDVKIAQRDLSGEIAALRGEIAALRNDLSGEIAALGHRMEQQIMALRGEIKEMKVGFNSTIFKILVPTITVATTILGVLIVLIGR